MPAAACAAVRADSLAASRIVVHVASMFAGAGLSQHQWPSNGSPYLLYTGGSTGAERPDLDERRAERALTVTPIYS